MIMFIYQRILEPNKTHCRPGRQNFNKLFIIFMAKINTQQLKRRIEISKFRLTSQSYNSDNNITR